MQCSSHHFDTHPVKAITTYKTRSVVQPYIKSSKSSQEQMSALQVCHITLIYTHVAVQCKQNIMTFHLKQNCQKTLSQAK
jgi:hypothetical protein